MESAPVCSETGGLLHQLSRQCCSARVIALLIMKVSELQALEITCSVGHIEISHCGSFIFAEVFAKSIRQMCQEAQLAG